MHPKCVVTVNGVPVAGIFWEKLVRITVTDNEGGKADTVDITLEDGPPFLFIPRKGDLICVWMGYEDGPFDYMGAFKVDDVECECLPWMLNIKGTSADLRENLKEHRQRHWDGKKLGDALSEMAGEAGLSPQIDPEVASYTPENKWIGQAGESALHFANRWARRFGCTFSVKDGKFIIAKKSSGQTPGGSAVGGLVIVPTMIVKGTCKVKWGQRERHKDVRAHYHDPKSGERKFVDQPTGDSSAQSRFTLRHAAADKDEATRAAKGRARNLGTAGTTTSVTIEGNPFAKAGATMTYAGVRPGVDRLPFVIESAAHSYSRAGYTTQLNGKIKDGADSGAE